MKYYGVSKFLYIFKEMRGDDFKMLTPFGKIFRNYHLLSGGIHDFEISHPSLSGKRAEIR